MVATYLKHIGQGDADLGALTIGFLKHHAQLEYMTTAISLDSGYTERLADDHALFIQDQLFTLSLGFAKNLANATCLIQRLEAIFRDACKRLQDAKSLRALLESSVA